MADAAGPLLGATLVLDVGAPAHGGSCVARHEGRAVFVRHALPGERVRAVVTEDRGGGYCRADAVEVLVASADRVPPPCPYAGPGRCGGCDWQHATAPAQRALKAAVVREQFARVARLDVAGVFAGVEELPGGLLGWRTRIVYAVDRDGRPGLHRHRSTEIEHVDRCLLGAAGIGDASVLGDRWPGLTGVEVARGDGPDVAVLAHRPGAGRQSRGRRPPDRVRTVAGPDVLHHDLPGQTLAAAAGGFWQVHPAAAAAFTAALRATLSPQPGETVLDLYSGAGALTADLARAVTSTGRVVGIESDPRAVGDAERNLAGFAWAEVRRARVDGPTLAGAGLEPDLVVLDPPRAGAGRDVMTALLALEPRAVGYLSCDPSTLARDVATAHELGWRLVALRAFDAFPMTNHVECLATLMPGTEGPEPLTSTT
ncbi:MAG TPA: TRAM domain-containing protein [Jatrophihabitans sp.]|nr:TRAM domain-containing protein [Jatrophihabitans sp.]